MMSEEINVLKRVCHRLEKAKIPYMVTGSFAANIYTVPRMTRDLDIVIEIHQQDINRFYQVFQKDFYIEKESVMESILQEGMFNIIDNEFVFKIDFIIRKNSDYRATEFKRMKQHKLDDSEIWVVAPEDLIISKLIWAKESLSEMQIRDIRNLFQSINTLDKNYIMHWVDLLGLKTVFEKAEQDE